MNDTDRLQFLVALADKGIFLPLDAQAVLDALDCVQTMEKNGWKFVPPPPNQARVYPVALEQTTTE